MPKTPLTRNVYAIGIGQYLPGEPIPIDSIDDILGEITKAPTAIVRRINRIKPVMKKLLGIKNVHYALDPFERKPTESNVSMAFKAATKAIDSAGIRPSDIDFLVYGGPTFDYMTPPSSTLVQERLGIEYCAEMAIHGNCTSVYKAVQVAADEISLGRYNRALIVASQIASKFFHVDFLNEQRLTVDQAILRWFLSDGAGAIVLSSENNGSMNCRVVDTYIESVGAHLEPGMVGFQTSEELSLLKIYEMGKHHLSQDLNKVGKMAPKITREAFVRVINSTGLDTSRVKCVLVNVPMRHLRTFAEQTMTDLIANPDTVMYSNISQVGYAGPAASIISLDSYLAENRLEQSNIVVSFAVESSKWMHGAFILEAVS